MSDDATGIGVLSDPAPASSAGQGALRSGAIGVWDALACTLANLAPAEAIFAVIGLIAASMGTATPWAFVVGGVAIAATGWNLSEFASRLPSAGSYVGFIYHGGNAIRPGNGRYLAGIAFYLGMIGGSITIASVSVFLGSWLQAACDLPNVWWLIIALAGIAVSLPILLRGISASTQVSFILFAVEAVGLAIFAVVVLAKSGGAIALPFHPTGGSPGGFSGLNGIVFATVLFAYVGWENSAGLAEELRNPHRNVPIAVLGSIALILVLYVLVAWATVAGYGAWKGAAAGMTRLGDPNNAAPLVELTDHFMPWFHWVMIVIGVTSACGCYIAALTHVSRWTYASARSGLMPKPLDTISPRSGVPAAAIWFLNLVIAFFVVASYFVFKGNAVTGTAYLAGIGSVPLIVAYLLVSLLCPIYVWRRDRARFSFLRHVLPSVIGVLSVGEAIYVSVQPNQPPPANMFWIYILAILAIAVVATVFVVTTRGEAVDRLGYTVPPDAAE